MSSPTNEDSSSRDNPDQVTLDFQNFEELEFENDGEARADIDLGDQNVFGSHELPLGGDGGEQQQQQQQQSASKAFWTVEFYQPYFNVTTTEFLTRVVKSWTFFRPDFLNHAEENGSDMWGPFWICATFVALLSVTSNISNLFQWSSSTPGEGGRPIGEWANDFTTVSVGAIVISLYAVIVPSILWAVMKWKDVKVSLIQVLSLYGYAFSLVLPFTLFCLITFDLVRWFAVFIGFLLSATTIFVNLFDAFSKGITGPDRVPALIGMAVYVYVMHLALALFVKIFFYSFLFL